MSSHKTAGVLLAATAAAVFSTANIAYAAGESMATAQVKCSGVNSCKGMSECATAANSCKGHNSCKGKGWMHMSKADCEAKGGTVVQEGK
jgi:hypothetical protein